MVTYHTGLLIFSFFSNKMLQVGLFFVIAVFMHACMYLVIISTRNKCNRRVQFMLYNTSYVDLQDTRKTRCFKHLSNIIPKLVYMYAVLMRIILIRNKCNMHTAQLLVFSLVVCLISCQQAKLHKMIAGLYYSFTRSDAVLYITWPQELKKRK